MSNGEWTEVKQHGTRTIVHVHYNKWNSSNMSYPINNLSIAFISFNLIKQTKDGMYMCVIVIMCI